MLPQQQQQPGTPIKAATAPGAASPSSFASGAQGVHRRNLASLGGPAPFGLTVFWVVISILGSILQVAGLVRKGGGGRERKKKKGLFRRKKQLDKLIDLDLSTSKKKKKKKNFSGRSPVLLVPLRNPGFRGRGQLLAAVARQLPALGLVDLGLLRGRPLRDARPGPGLGLCRARPRRPAGLGDGGDGPLHVRGRLFFFSLSFSFRRERRKKSSANLDTPRVSLNKRVTEKTIRPPFSHQTESPRTGFTTFPQTRRARSTRRHALHSLDSCSRPLQALQ